MTVTGYETPPAVWDQDTTLQLNINAPTASAGNPEVGVTFMTPTSGRVLVIVGGGARDNTAVNRVFLQPEIYRGTQVIDEQTDSGVFREFITPGEADMYIYGSRATVVDGLVPLRQHYARVVHSNTGAGGTAEISVREIVVIPLP